MADGLRASAPRQSRSVAGEGFNSSPIPRLDQVTRGHPGPTYAQRVGQGEILTRVVGGDAASWAEPHLRKRRTDGAEGFRPASSLTVKGRLFERFDETNEQAVLSEIRTQLNAWRYIERLIEQLDPDYDPNRADFR